MHHCGFANLPTAKEAAILNSRANSSILTAMSFTDRVQ